MLESLIPSLGVAVAGAVAWAARRYVKHLLTARKEREARVRALEQSVSEAERDEGRLLLDRQSALWEEQHAFATDLHGAVKRLSDSNAKKDREIETLRASLTAARDEAFETNHALRTKSRELEDAQEEIERLKARPPPMPFSFEGD